MESQEMKDGVGIKVDEDADLDWLGSICIDIAEQEPESDSKELKSFTEDLSKAIGDTKQPQERKIIVIPRLDKTPGQYSESTPRIISIGPSYWSDPRLNEMKAHKIRYLDSILQRNSARKIEDYYVSLKKMEDKVWSAYEEFDNSVDVMEMMLLDGCFIVEYFLRIHERKEDELNSSNYTRRKIEYGMLLLQNQLPFFVVQCIFNLLTDYARPSLLPEIIVKHFIRSSFIQKTPLKHYAPQISPPTYIHHLLHLFHSVLKSAREIEMSRPGLPSSMVNFKSKLTTLMQTTRGRFMMSSTVLPSSKVNLKPRLAKLVKPTQNIFHSSDSSNVEKEVSSIPSATELEDAGINVRKGNGIFAVTFHRGIIFQRARIKIPPLKIDAFTKTLIKDLVLFEKLDRHPSNRPKFTAHVKFFDNIINTSADVALLRSRGIIDHSLGSDNDVATLFNTIGGSNFCHLPTYLSRVYEDVNEYCKETRHRWWASFLRRYFSSPWSFIKLLAATILLVLTFIQTFYAVYSYHRPHGS